MNETNTPYLGLTPHCAPEYNVHLMISQTVNAYNLEMKHYITFGAYKKCVSNGVESVTEISRHYQFSVTVILTRPPNLALFLQNIRCHYGSQCLGIVFGVKRPTSGYILSSKGLQISQTLRFSVNIGLTLTVLTVNFFARVAGQKVAFLEFFDSKLF